MSSQNQNDTAARNRNSLLRLPRLRFRKPQNSSSPESLLNKNEDDSISNTVVGSNSTVKGLSMSSQSSPSSAGGLKRFITNGGKSKYKSLGLEQSVLVTENYATNSPLKSLRRSAMNNGSSNSLIPQTKSRSPPSKQKEPLSEVTLSQTNKNHISLATLRSSPTTKKSQHSSLSLSRNTPKQPKKSIKKKKRKSVAVNDGNRLLFQEEYRDHEDDEEFETSSSEGSIQKRFREGNS